MPSATFFNLPPAKREKLLAAARAEFVRAPFAQASVNRIIHGAGIPRGSFYMYFADKEELFRYLMEDFGTQLIRQMERLLEERNGAVFAAFLDLFDYVQDRRAEYRDLQNILRRNGDMRPGLFPGECRGGLPEGLRERMDLARLDLREAGDLEAILHQLFFLTGGALMRSAGPGGPEAARAGLVRRMDILRRGAEKQAAPPAGSAAEAI